MGDRTGEIRHHRHAESLPAPYPGFNEFLAVRERLDLGRVFANDCVRQVSGQYLPRVGRKRKGATIKAIVCGAGIAGLTVAGQLANKGWQVTLLEAAAERRTQGYMIDFFGPGYDAAEKIGILDRLRELRYPITEARFVRPNGRRQSVDYGVVAALSLIHI